MVPDVVAWDSQGMKQGGLGYLKARALPPWPILPDNFGVGEVWKWCPGRARREIYIYHTYKAANDDRGAMFSEGGYLV